jgi:hypothetical protein
VNPFGSTQRAAQIDGQRVAGDQQAPRASVRETVQYGLDDGAQRPMVDPAGRLVQHADHGQTVQRRRAHERRGDAVEHQDVRGAAARRSDDGRAVQHGRRKRPLGKRDEDQARIHAGRKLGQTPMEQIPAAERAGIPERHQGSY